MTGAGFPERFMARMEQGDFDGLTTLYTDDALFDAHVPNWRFQVRGRGEIAEQMKAWFQLPGRFHDVHEEWTAAGEPLVRFEWREREGSSTQIVSREMQLWRLNDGRIAEQLVFCAGRWDVALVERMAAEAPLVRP